MTVKRVNLDKLAEKVDLDTAILIWLGWTNLKPTCARNPLYWGNPPGDVDGPKQLAPYPCDDPITSDDIQDKLVDDGWIIRKTFDGVCSWVGLNRSLVDDEPCFSGLADFTDSEESHIRSRMALVRAVAKLIDASKTEEGTHSHEQQSYI